MVIIYILGIPRDGDFKLHWGQRSRQLTSQVVHKPPIHVLWKHNSVAYDTPYTCTQLSKDWIWVQTWFYKEKFAQRHKRLRQLNAICHDIYHILKTVKKRQEKGQSVTYC